jgi:hypothetical protein
MNATSCTVSTDCPIGRVCRSFDQLCGCPRGSGIAGRNCDQLTGDSAWFIVGHAAALPLLLAVLVQLMRMLLKPAAPSPIRRAALGAGVACCVCSCAADVYGLATIFSIRPRVEYKIATSGLLLLAASAGVNATLTIAAAWIDTALRSMWGTAMDERTLRTRRAILCTSTGPRTLEVFRLACSVVDQSSSPCGDSRRHRSLHSRVARNARVHRGALR